VKNPDEIIAAARRKLDATHPKLDAIETTAEKLEIALSWMFLDTEAAKDRARDLFRQHVENTHGKFIADFLFKDEGALLEALRESLNERGLPYPCWGFSP
jgi:hypothetical protein